MSEPLNQPIKDCLIDLVGWLSDSSIPYSTIGGVAVSLMAAPRFTRDIDAVIWIDRDQWENFIEQAISRGFLPRNSDPIDFARQYRLFLLTHRATGVNVDISLGALPFESEMIARSKLLEIETLKINIPTPEDLIIMKLIAGRQQDLADVESIARLHPALDLTRIEYWLDQFSAALEMPEISERLNLLKGAGV